MSGGNHFYFRWLLTTEKLLKDAVIMILLQSKLKRLFLNNQARISVLYYFVFFFFMTIFFYFYLFSTGVIVFYLRFMFELLIWCLNIFIFIIYIFVVKYYWTFFLTYKKNQITSQILWISSNSWQNVGYECIVKKKKHWTEIYQ